MSDQINQAFSLVNLRRCWGWIKSNPEAGYKGYFRHIYRAYELGIDKNLEELSRKLKKGLFQPSFAEKLYFPKGSGLLRPWTLLGVEDQIAYMAAASIAAIRLHPRVRRQYETTVFGNLYAGKKSDFFYRDWRRCYRSYTDAMRNAYASGHRWTASFDLTACYDSIDHRVLRDRLLEIKVDQDLVDMLMNWLCHWTVHDQSDSIYIEHGIPQGPLPSGMLSEVVLSYFDKLPQIPDTVYLRYVDDIRLFGEQEDVIRRQLIELDLASKRIGLFPQSSKIKIHAVDDIEDEIKGISNPPEQLYDDQGGADQHTVELRLNELSKGLRIHDDTRFKYVLGHARPNSRMSRRLLKLLERYPHLHATIGRHLEKTPSLSKAVSGDVMSLVREHDVYPSFTASLVCALTGRVHHDYKSAFTAFCTNLFRGRKGPNDPGLRMAAGRVAILSASSNWSLIDRLVTNSESWWVRASLIQYVKIDHVGPASAADIANRLIRDCDVNVASTASDYLLTHDLKLNRPYTEVNRCAQSTLRKAKIIGSIRRNDDPISDCVKAVLGNSVAKIEWRQVLGPVYKDTLPLIVRWTAYSKSDATSWINITDTFMDRVFDRYFSHSSTLGTYVLGKIGSVLYSSTSTLATVNPKLYLAARHVHDLRLESDLSHPITRTTGKPTRFIRYKEMQAVLPMVAAGFEEMWASW